MRRQPRMKAWKRRINYGEESKDSGRSLCFDAGTEPDPRGSGPGGKHERDSGVKRASDGPGGICRYQQQEGSRRIGGDSQREFGERYGGAGRRRDKKSGNDGAGNHRKGKCQTPDRAGAGNGGIGKQKRDGSIRKRGAGGISGHFCRGR